MSRQAWILKKTGWSILSPRLRRWLSCFNAGWFSHNWLYICFNNSLSTSSSVFVVHICIQVSNKYSLIYVVTKLGLLFVYDLETATAVYRNRISPDPIFLTVDSPATGGFYAINRRGQVLLATVNESTIVPFVSGQVLCFPCFQELFLSSFS